MSEQQPALTEELELVWFRQIFERAPDAIVVVDNDGQIILVNRQTERLFGYPREELLNKPVETLIPDELRSSHSVTRKAYFGEPKVREMGADLDLSGRRKDGSEFPIEISLSPLDTPRGLFAAAAVRDITARKQDERRLQEYAQTLKASNVQLEQFAYVASHDLQAPLRNIVGFNQLLQRKLSASCSPDETELFGIIDECARRMQSLIDGLLELSRVNSTRLKRKPLSVSTLVDHARLQLQSTLEDANATVECRSEASVEGDEALLTQLLQNLISNGVKFQPDGAQPKIVIESERSGGGRQTIRIQDNGIGIDTEKLDAIFTMFRRLHSAEEYPGTGIGLAVCQKIVELHDGRIWAESSPGEGTCFCVELPAA